jgi:hypothetical protein
MTFRPACSTGEQQRVPLPKSCPKLDNAEDREKMVGSINAASIAAAPSFQRNLAIFLGCRRAHYCYYVRTSVDSVRVDGKTKLEQENSGVKLWVAVTVT